ncbi:peptide chain release factor N(5)-glutamine methyltransferase [Candidatus Poribacteria bacterium]|nr:peptide chain release factor N(5)-glutamine methyltransferase [Candidatus Poribacteria bacterium]
MLTISEVILKSAGYLGRKGVDSPRLDAELLLCRVLGCERLRLYMDWHKPLVELEVEAYRELIRRRGQERVPVARLLERKEFYGREFTVRPGSFVPRPETEGLVERALDLLSKEPALQTERPAVFDVGTGTGAIIVTLALESGLPHYFASDVSTAALETARENARRHHALERIEFREGPLLAGYRGALHLIVSNPPYIRSGEIPTLPPEVRKHDPMPALDGGEDGLDVVRGILAAARESIVHGGCVLLELGEDQEDGVLALFRETGIFEDARMDRDYAGKPRYAFARRKT